MCKIIFVLFVSLISFFNYQYAETMPKVLPLEILDESDLSSFYQGIEAELAVQEGRISTLTAQLSSHKDAPANLIYTQYKLAVTMLDVKISLAENFYESPCLDYSEFREAFLTIFCKEVITHYDLLQLKVLAQKFSS